MHMHMHMHEYMQTLAVRSKARLEALRAALNHHVFWFDVSVTEAIVMQMQHLHGCVVPAAPGSC
jgi:short subunit dehydrogenase-like uncharacterized protein